MALMNFITIAGVNSIWKPIISLLDWMNNGIGNFGWTVVVFAIVLRIVLLPLDIWQKISMRKQKDKMDQLRPQLEKIQKQYANRPDILRQKQYELQKSANIKMLSSCLPMIFTLVIFAIVFQGFREYIIYVNEKIVTNLYNDVYLQFFIDNAQVISSANGNIQILDSAGNLLAGFVPSYGYIEQAGLVDQLNQQLVAGYSNYTESWLWVKNVFMSDTFSNVIPSFDNFVSSGLGGIAASIPEITGVSYNELMGPIMAAYNKTSFFDIKNWNGYFLLPILSIATSFFATVLQQKLQPAQIPTGTEAQQKQQKIMNKVMIYMMPLILGFFAIMYSAAFAIYYFISNVITTVTSVIFNLIVKKAEKAKNADDNVIITQN